MSDKTTLNDNTNLQDPLAQVGLHQKNNTDKLEVLAVSIDPSDNETPKSTENRNYQKGFCLRNKIRSGKASLISTFHKRNPIINGLLSVLFAGNTLVCLFVLLISLAYSWSTAIAGTFYCLYCIYYMYEFTIANRKEALLYSWMGSVVVWTCFIFIYVLLTTPEPYRLEEAGIEDYTTDTEYFFISMIWSIVLNGLGVLLIRLLMKFKKYGATAWTLLDVSHRRFRRKLDKIAFILFFIIWTIPFFHIMYASNAADEKPNVEACEVNLIE